MKETLLAIFSIMLCSCASTSNSDLWNNDEIFQNIVVKHDSFRQHTSYTAPSITIDNTLSKKTWFVRVFELRDSTLFTQIHVSFSYLDNSWRYLANAKSKGELFPTRSIRQHVTNCNETAVCSYKEDVIITVSLDKLTNMVNENGTAIFEITDRLGESWLVKLKAGYIGAIEAKLDV